MGGLIADIEASADGRIGIYPDSLALAGRLHELVRRQALQRRQLRRRRWRNRLETRRRQLVFLEFRVALASGHGDTQRRNDKNRLEQFHHCPPVQLQTAASGFYSIQGLKSRFSTSPKSPIPSAQAAALSAVWASCL